MTAESLNVLVTGGAGRIGRQVIDVLQQHGHRATSFDLRDAHRLGDIDDLGQLASALAGHDALVHMARAASKHANPVVFQSNVVGTFNALEAAAITGVRRVVVASSVAVLNRFFSLSEPPEYLPLDEAHPLAPFGTYSLAKRLVEQMCETYTRQHGMLTVAVRPTLVIGPDEYGDKVEKYLGADASRVDYLRAYVDSRDVAQLCVRCLENLTPGQHRVYFANGPDALCREPLSELLPREYPQVPGIAKLAAPLTGTTPAVSTQRAREEVGYVPRYSWRDLYPELA